MVVVTPGVHEATAHSRPIHGPSGISIGMFVPRSGPFEPVLPPPTPAAPPADAPAVAAGSPATVLSLPAGEQERPTTPPHTKPPTTTEQRIHVAILKRIMCTPARDTRTPEAAVVCPFLERNI